MSELTRIALSIFVYAFLAFVYIVVVIAVVSETRRWLRHRHDEPIEPSPLIREINAWRQAHDRAFQRAGIVELQGHPRIGIDPIKRRRGV